MKGMKALMEVQAGHGTDRTSKAVTTTAVLILFVVLVYFIFLLQQWSHIF